MQLVLAEDRAATIEEKATTVEVMVGVTQAIGQYKVSTKFKDEVSEAFCDAFHMGFEECKRKVAQVFNISDL